MKIKVNLFLKNNNKIQKINKMEEIKIMKAKIMRGNKQKIKVKKNKQIKLNRKNN